MRRISPRAGAGPLAWRGATEVDGDASILSGQD